MLVGLIWFRSATIKILFGRILLVADVNSLAEGAKQKRVEARPISVNMRKITVTFALGAFMKPRRMRRRPIAELLLLNVPQRPASPGIPTKQALGPAAIREFSAPRFLEAYTGLRIGFYGG